MKIIVYKENNKLFEKELDSFGHFFIGRKEDCFIVLQDHSISRHLASLSKGPSDSFWSLTFLNTHPNVKFEKIEKDFSLQTPYLLESSSTVFIGNFCLEFLIEENQKQESETQEERGIEQTEEKKEEELEEQEQLDSDNLSFTENLEQEGLQEGIQGELQEEQEEAEEKTSILSSFLSIKLRLFGENIPYDIYNLENSETVFIGSAPPSEILLPSEEIGPQHSKITVKGSQLLLEDLGHTTGTLFQGERIKRAFLKNGDEFLIGNTAFKVEISSALLKEEAPTIMPTQAYQEIEIEKEIEVPLEELENDLNFQTDSLEENQKRQSSNETSSSSKSLVGKLKASWQDPSKRKKIIYIAAALALGLLFLEEEKPAQPPSTAKTEEKKQENSKNTQNNETGATETSGTQQTGENSKKESKKLSQEELEFVESKYLLGKKLLEIGDYMAAVKAFEDIKMLDENYKNSPILLIQAHEGLKKLAELEKEKNKEIERRKRLEQIEKLMEEANASFKEKKFVLAENFIAQILSKDPEHYKASQLRLEIKNLQEEEKRKKEEKEKKERERNALLQALSPGKTFFKKQEWYNAIIKLEDFLKLSSIDEDLLNEASEMLKKAKENLKSHVENLASQAQNFEEGNDLKNAYETYDLILKADPTHEKALNQLSSLRDLLVKRARVIYREGLIAESLSIFDKAKEKFEQTKIIAPNNSEYYKKAEAKLKDYIQ